MWKLTSKPQIVLEDPPYFRLLKKSYVTANGRVIPNYYLLDNPNWVNVVALTKNFEMILIKQFRPGVDRMITGLPAGCIDHNEDPEVAAMRELKEESGYTAQKLILLSTQYANPAQQQNVIYSFLALNAEPIPNVVLDPDEETEPFLISFTDHLKEVLQANMLVDHQVHFTSAVLFAMTYILKIKDPSLVPLKQKILEVVGA